MPQTKGQQVQIDIKNNTSAFYLLNIQQGRLTQTKKVMINK